MNSATPSSDSLHDLAIAWAELLEVGLDTLDEHSFAVGDELQLLEVHLTEDEGHDGQDSLMVGLVDDGDHQTLQGLTHLDIDLTTQGQHHRADALRQVHAALEALVDLLTAGGGEVCQMH